MNDVKSEFEFYCQAVYGGVFSETQACIMHHAFYSGVMVGLLLFTEGVASKKLPKSASDRLINLAKEAYLGAKEDETEIQKINVQPQNDRNN